MVLSKVMIMKLNKSLDCFFHRAQLDESHFAVFSKSEKESVNPNHILKSSSLPKILVHF